MACAGSTLHRTAVTEPSGAMATRSQGEHAKGNIQYGSGVEASWNFGAGLRGCLCALLVECTPGCVEAAGTLSWPSRSDVSVFAAYPRESLVLCHGPRNLDHSDFQDRGRSPQVSIGA